MGAGFGSGEMGDYQYVFALETYGDVLHAAGNFMQSGDRILYRAARWDAQAWQPMGAGTDDEVAVLCSGPFGLYAGGEFMGAGAAPSWRMGHWVADVSDVSPGSTRLAVDLCVPNPYRPGDTIRVHLPAKQPLRVAVYGVDGRRLARLSDDALFEGNHELRWDGKTPDGRRLPAGLYYLNAHSGNARVHTGFVLNP